MVLSIKKLVEKRLLKVLGEFRPLAGVDFFLSLGPELLLYPPLEFNHVGHELCVLHADFRIWDNLLLFSNFLTARVFWGSGRGPASDG